MIDRPYIEYFHIKGFRSFADIEFHLQPGANVLIGANGSGKSNFIRFFEMLSWMLKSRRLAQFIELQGGADDQLHGGSEMTPGLNAEIAILIQVKPHNSISKPLGQLHIYYGIATFINFITLLPHQTL